MASRRHHSRHTPRPRPVLLRRCASGTGGLHRLRTGPSAGGDPHHDARRPRSSKAFTVLCGQGGVVCGPGAPAGGGGGGVAPCVIRGRLPSCGGCGGVRRREDGPDGHSVYAVQTGVPRGRRSGTVQVRGRDPALILRCDWCAVCACACHVHSLRVCVAPQPTPWCGALWSTSPKCTIAPV